MDLRRRELLLSLSAAATFGATMEDSTREFTLPNGMTWIVMPRAGAKDLALVTYTDSGIAQEERGRTGVSRILREWVLLQAKAAGWKDPLAIANSDRILLRSVVAPEELDRLVEAEARRVGAPDFANVEPARAAALAQRDRRSGPGNWVLSEFQSTAFLTHPYCQPDFGYAGELEKLTRADVESFYRRTHAPSNLIVTVVGAASYDGVLASARRHFGPLPAAPRPEPLRSVEPPQPAERRILLPVESPGVLMGFHKCSVAQPAAPVWSVLFGILTRRLKRALVEEAKIAARADAHHYPGMKYPGLILLMIFCAPGKSGADVEQAVWAQLDRLKSTPVPEEEFTAARSAAVADLEKESSANLAIELADWQAMAGTWRQMYRHQEQTARVTSDDVQKLAQQTFTRENLTIAAPRTSSAS